jgi:hypothetical protein
MGPARSASLFQSLNLVVSDVGAGQRPQIEHLSGVVMLTVIAVGA